MKLLLADDHTLFRDALVQYIERSDLDADVQVAKDLHQVLGFMEEDADRSLVVLDMRMPGMDGMDGFRIMKEKYPNVPVALMSGVAEEKDVMVAFENGACGYFPKTMSGKALLQAIKLVLTGERYMPMGIGNNVMPSYFGDKPSASVVNIGTDVGASKDVFKLTPRETEVLSHLIQGLSNKEIANVLGLQVVTVKLHVRGICRKLDVKNRTQAALKAREYSLCPAVPMASKS
ncbi:MAG: response regulator transcription factor [Micavibrio sp.]|nr:response regulator transcription factor [Micavibrio sp.]